MSTLAIEFSFVVEPPRRILLGTLRDRLTAAAAASSAALAAVCAIDGCEIGMLQDWVATAITEQPADLADMAHRCRRTSRAAARRSRRDGFDTWPAKDLARYIQATAALADALTAQDCAWQAVLQAEISELAAYHPARAVAG